MLSQWAEQTVKWLAEVADPRQIINLRDYDRDRQRRHRHSPDRLDDDGHAAGHRHADHLDRLRAAVLRTEGLYLVSTNAFRLLEAYPLVAVPLFVLMASILEKAGIAEDLFDAMSIFAGNLRGGVAVQTVVVAVVMAAMSGIMGGEIVMLGLVALPQMLRLGYDRKLSIGTICASGSLRHSSRRAL